MTSPKPRRFYDALREHVRSAYESQRNAATPTEEDTPISAPESEETDSETRALSRSVWRSESRSESRSVNQCEGQCGGQSQGQSQGQCEDQCGGQSQGQCEDQCGGQSQDQCEDQCSTKLYSLDNEKTALCLSLGENPKRLLAAMIAIEQRWICLNHIPLRAQNGTFMTYPSKRTSLKRLTELGFILTRKKKDFGTNKGLTYTLDETLCDVFQATFPGFVEQEGKPFAVTQSVHIEVEHCEGQCGGQSQGQCGGQSESRSVCLGPFSSSIKILTTRAREEERHRDEEPETSFESTHGAGEALFALYENHPEYAFWREQRVGLRQLEHWLEEFQLDPLLMDEYLRWCAYDLGVGERTDKNGAPIDNAQNWFYGLLKRTGAYPRPSGYKSLEEKRVEQLEAARAEREALARRNEALLVQDSLADVQEAFAKLMAEGEGNATYCELREQLPPFVRKQEGVGRGKIFEIGMWNAFKKLSGLVTVEERETA